MPSLFHAPNVYATILEMVRVDGMRHGTHIDDASFMDDLLSDPTEQIDLLTNGETGLSLAELATLSQLRLYRKRILQSSK